MKKRQCVSCGAPIPLGAMKCEYCGMTYEPEYWEGLIRYVPIHRNCKQLCAEARVRREVVYIMGSDHAGEMVRHELAHKIADALVEVMDVKVCEDYRHDETVVRGSVWVEQGERT